MKRFLDVLLSLLAIIFLSPLMLVICLIIICDDGMPVIFRQDRVGRGDKLFKIKKFRTMKNGAPNLSTADFEESDEYITRSGKFLRRTSLDELPQLFNILGGSMSVVGPRPERPEIAREYEAEMPEFCLRFQAKAGLTGYAQVYGKYNTEPYDKLQMDLMYIAQPSLVEDLRIIFATIKILFMPESTEGIEAGQTTAEKRQMSTADNENDIKQTA